MTNNTTISLWAVAAHHLHLMGHCHPSLSNPRVVVLSTRSGLATRRIRHTMQTKEEGNAAMGVDKSSANPLPRAVNDGGIHS